MDVKRSIGDPDEWLDGALAEYGKAAPDAGLEERVLAHLRAHAGNRGRLPWMKIMGIAAAALLALSLWIHRFNEPAAPPEPSPTHKAESQPSVITPETVTAPSHPNREVRTRVLPKPHKNPRAAPQTPEPLPRRDVFPSDAPLSEQEKLLLAFAHGLSNGSIAGVPDKISLQPIEIPKIVVPVIELQNSTAETDHTQK